MDGYKIGESYANKPMDLSNYLLIRTREKMMLQSRVQGFITGGSSLHQRLFNDTFKANLDSCSNDLAENMQHLRVGASGDLPVAYATNTMYVLARNGLSTKFHDKI